MVSVHKRGLRYSSSTFNPQMRSKLGLVYKTLSGSSEVIQMTSGIVSAICRKRSSLCLTAASPCEGVSNRCPVEHPTLTHNELLAATYRTTGPVASPACTPARHDLYSSPDGAAANKDHRYRPAGPD